MYRRRNLVISNTILESILFLQWKAFIEKFFGSSQLQDYDLHHGVCIMCAQCESSNASSPLDSGLPLLMSKFDRKKKSQIWISPSKSGVHNYELNKVVRTTLAVAERFQKRFSGRFLERFLESIKLQLCCFVGTSVDWFIIWSAKGMRRIERSNSESPSDWNLASFKTVRSLREFFFVSDSQACSVPYMPRALQWIFFEWRLALQSLESSVGTRENTICGAFV